jgi:hypothetical protein
VPVSGPYALNCNGLCAAVGVECVHLIQYVVGSTGPCVLSVAGKLVQHLLLTPPGLKGSMEIECALCTL